MKFIFGLKSDKLYQVNDWDFCEENPLGGSETALLRMASTFRDLGHEVEIVNYPSDVKEFEDLMANKTCDIFINLRLPEPFLILKRLPGKVNYYWAQDDSDQLVLDPIKNQEWRKIFYERVTGLFLLSNYQRGMWKKDLNLDLNKTRLIHNPIPYDRFKPDLTKLKKRKPLAYYSSVPFRGLDLLLKAWPFVQKLVPNAQLHVFSSFKVYGGEETDATKALYEQATTTPGVVYRGSVGQRELREFAVEARVLAYPCCFPETSCIAAMEAMAAGAVVVSTELGALPETAWKNVAHPIADGWLDRWVVDVAKLLVDNDYYEKMALQNREISKFYDAKNVAAQMSQVFREDLAALEIRVNLDLQPV